jgi:SAM-dependent methyltransferase
MNMSAAASARRLARSVVARALGPKFAKHYVKPRRVGRGAVPYDARRFFESWHAASSATGLNDAETVAAGRSPLATRYHYNSVENAILEHSTDYPLPDGPRVLDVGSGAGHWIDFYRDVLGASTLVGVEISEVGADWLREKYGSDERVRVLVADVSDPAFTLGERFDVVNAIGVMFHIVDDEGWEQALRNLAAVLAPGGVIVVGGQFGWTTQNVQFHRRDEFASWEEFRRAEPGALLVNKRIRSLRRWRAAARAAGLRVVGVQRTPKHPSLETPENNVLVLARNG